VLCDVNLPREEDCVTVMSVLFSKNNNNNTNYLVASWLEFFSMAPGAIFFYDTHLDFLPRGEDSFMPNHLLHDAL
jgi:hypothetical protein